MITGSCAAEFVLAQANLFGLAATTGCSLAPSIRIAGPDTNDVKGALKPYTEHRERCFPSGLAILDLCTGHIDLA